MIDFITEIKHFPQLVSNWVKFILAFASMLPYLIVGFYVNIVGMLLRIIFPPREESLLNEVIILVGVGKSPIGIQLATKLAETNAKIVLIDKPQVDNTYEPLIRKIKESGEMAFFYDCEVTDKFSVRNTIDTIEKDVGRVTMLFHGNLLTNASNKDLTSSYVNLTDTLLPRMQAGNKGHMVFLSLINGNIDYVHQHFAQGLFDSILAEIRTMRAGGAKINMTQVSVHKKLLTQYSTADHTAKFGIFGTADASSLAKKIIKGVRQKKLFVTMPSYMTHVPKYLKLLPSTTADTLVDSMYRVY